MLSDEQAEKIKFQLIAQIEKSFPHDKKEFAISQIQSMDPDHLENFLKQNQLIKGQAQGPTNQPVGGQCVFCSIARGEIKSHKIDENSDALAVLEINPVSAGHTLVIPKEHLSSSDKLTKSVFSLAKNIAKKIKSKLSPKDVTIVSSNLMGHEIINLIPVYAGETLESERKHLEHQELTSLQESLEKKTQPTVKRLRVKVPKVSTPEQKRWLPRRIP